MTDNVLRNYTRRFEFAFYFLHALTEQFEESSNPVFDVQKAHHAFSFFIFDLASWEVLDDTYPFDKESGRYPQLDGAISVAVTFKILKKSPPHKTGSLWFLRLEFCVNSSLVPYNACQMNKGSEPNNVQNGLHISITSMFPSSKLLLPLDFYKISCSLDGLLFIEFFI